jgi:EmrB/QacA subfamily drug resistance transporter
MSTVRRTPILAIILVSYLMIVLDISIVITALPMVHRDLSFSATGLSWVQDAYTLAFGGLLLLGARAGDIFGRRRMFVAGIALFTAASLAAGTAQSATWLLSARTLQGVGAAILAPATLALLSTNFAEGPERTRAVAYYGAVAGAGASVGLVLGGMLTAWVSWRVGFLINVPIGIVLVLAAYRYLNETDRESGRFDVAGAASATLGMSALVFGIIRSATAGWYDPVTVAMLAAGVVLLVLFVVNEKRAKQPMVPLRVFANRERAAAYAARFLFIGAMFGFFFFTTQFLQGVSGFSPLEAGSAFLPMTVVSFAVAVGVPRLTHRLGNARLVACGLGITAFGMAWLSRISVDSSYLTGIALPMIVIGIGQGAALSPLTSAGIAGIAREDAGAASGVVNVAHQLGASLGLGILVAVFATAGASSADARTELAQRVGTSFTAATGMLVVAFVLAVVLIVRPRLAAARAGRYGDVAPEAEQVCSVQ